MRIHRWQGDCRLALSAALAAALSFGAACGHEDRYGPPGDPAPASMSSSGASVLLTVVDDDGAAIPSAAVTVHGVPAITDGEGRILLSDLPAGPFAARVAASGFTPSLVALHLTAGAPASAEVSLRPLSVEQWTVPYLGTIEAAGVVVDAAGDVVVAGSFSGTTDLGLGELDAAGDRDAFVMKLDPKGQTLWIRSFGDAGLQSVSGVAVDANGDVIVAGTLRGAVDFGGGPLVSGGGADVFVVKLAGADGGHLWSQRFGEDGDQLAAQVAVDGEGRVLVGAYVAGTLEFGGAQLVGQGPEAENSVFLLALDGAGAPLWARRWDDPIGLVFGGLAVDATNAVVITGGYGAGWAFGGTGVEGAFAVKIAKNGNPAWVHAWPNAFGRAVAVGPTGDVVLTGDVFASTVEIPGAGGAPDELDVSGVDFGAGPITDPLFVARLDVSGMVVWAHGVQGKPYAGVGGVAVDADGDVILTGELGGELDFGGGLIQSASLYDVYLAKLDAHGGYLGSQRVGDSKAVVRGPRVSVDGAGNVFFAASFAGKVDLGLDPVTSQLAGDPTAFLVAKLGP